jgi:response regulator of citrate/malate metabolism
VDVPKVVEVTLKHHKLPETMHGGILDHLIRDGDLSQYGLGNALTRYSQDVESYETTTQLEEIGADVMAMDERAWSRLTDLAKAMS